MAVQQFGVAEVCTSVFACLKGKEKEESDEEGSGCKHEGGITCREGRDRGGNRVGAGFFFLRKGMRQRDWEGISETQIRLSSLGLGLAPCLGISSPVS